MALVGLVSPVDTRAAIEQFSFQHKQDHDAINAALLTRNVRVDNVPLDPMPLDLKDAGQWLLLHQIQHNAMNQALGLQGDDLTKFDLSSTDQFQGFVGINYSEHSSVYDLLNAQGIQVGG